MLLTTLALRHLQEELQSSSLMILLPLLMVLKRQAGRWSPKEDLALAVSVEDFTMPEFNVEQQRPKIEARTRNTRQLRISAQFLLQSLVLDKNKLMPTLPRTRVYIPVLKHCWKVGKFWRNCVSQNNDTRTAWKRFQPTQVGRGFTVTCHPHWNRFSTGYKCR